MEEVFGLIDCNNFYVSCERVFPARSRRRSRHCALEERRLRRRSFSRGPRPRFKMGDPELKLPELIKRENVRVFSSNYALYGQMSDRVVQTLGSSSQRNVRSVAVYSTRSPRSTRDATTPGRSTFSSPSRWGHLTRALAAGVPASLEYIVLPTVNTRLSAIPSNTGRRPCSGPRGAASDFLSNWQQGTGWELTDPGVDKGAAGGSGPVRPL